MIRHILCPVDFSECSRRAVDAAVNVAAQFGAELTVAHVCSLAPPVATDIAWLAGPMRRSGADTARFERELRQLVEPARRWGVPTGTAVVEGDPCAEIVGLSESLGVDMVVMGTHGRSGLDRWILGSVAEKVLHRVRCPVMTVAEDGVSLPLGSRMGKILCAESLSDHSRALECALSLARHTDARLVVLHALEELPPEAARGVPPFEYGPSLMASAADRLWAMIPGAERARGRVDVAVVVGRAAEQILLRATQEKPDVIVMGVHARSPVDLMFWGSTARQVVRQAECPVLTVHGSVGPAWAEAETEGRTVQHQR